MANDVNQSLGGNLWHVAEVDERAAELIAQKYNLPYLVARILALRQININDVPLFMSPKIQSLMPNPFVLKDMAKAAERIASAVIKKQKIAIIGDYDVDGATSTSVLRSLLSEGSETPNVMRAMGQVCRQSMISRHKGRSC